jgi:hypothetical protein
MDLYELQISFPKIMNAPEQPRIWLENIFLAELNKAFLNRFDLKYEVVVTDEGPTLKIFNIEAHLMDTIESYVILRIKNMFSSSAILKYVTIQDIKVVKKRNFDELVKKLPELEGIF